MGLRTLGFAFLLAPGLALSAPAAPLKSPPAAQPQARIQREATSGLERLVVSERTRPIRLRIDELWRYDLPSDRWVRVPFAAFDQIAGPGTAIEMPAVTGLYWLKWSENGARYAGWAGVGRALCNDVMLPPTTRRNVVPTCIPGEKSATATYVPDPRIHAHDASSPPAPTPGGTTGPRLP